MSLPLASMAEEDVTEEALTIECKLKPESYATIYLAQNSVENSATGYHTSTRALRLYYNTPYAANDNIYTEYGSIILLSALQSKRN